MAFIPLEIIVVTVSKSVFYYPQLPFHPLGGDIVPVETTWHMLILLSRQGADTLPARIPAFLINTLLLSDKQRKFLKCLWRSWQGERYRKAWEIRGDDLLPCVCSFYVSRQEQSQAVERLCPQQGPHCSQILRATCNTHQHRPSLAPSRTRALHRSRSLWPASRWGSSSESVFDVASSLLPPNFFPLQNLLANFKGLLASCLNPVYWDL